jgi:hypothetical protein
MIEVAGKTKQKQVVVVESENLVETHDEWSKTVRDFGRPGIRGMAAFGCR